MDQEIGVVTDKLVPLENEIHTAEQQMEVLERSRAVLIAALDRLKNRLRTATEEVDSTRGELDEIDSFVSSYK